MLYVFGPRSIEGGLKAIRAERRGEWRETAPFDAGLISGTPVEMVKS